MYIIIFYLISPFLFPNRGNISAETAFESWVLRRLAGGGERLANKGLWGNDTFNDFIESDAQ